MRRFLKILTVLTLFLSPSLYAVPEYPWELKKNKEDILVHIRRVEGSPVLEYKGEMTVNQDLEKVLAFYEDYSQMPNWFDQCLESRLLDKKSENEKILYFAIDLPWPVNDRDAVYRRIRSKNSETGAVEFALSEFPEYKFPLYPGRVRMPEIHGIWRFTPLEGGKTRVYYQQHGNPGGFIPPVLMNQLVVSIPYKTLKNFREKIEFGETAKRPINREAKKLQLSRRRHE